MYICVCTLYLDMYMYIVFTYVYVQCIYICVCTLYLHICMYSELWIQKAFGLDVSKNLNRNYTSWDIYIFSSSSEQITLIDYIKRIKEERVESALPFDSCNLNNIFLKFCIQRFFTIQLVCVMIALFLMQNLKLVCLSCLYLINVFFTFHSFMMSCNLVLQKW